MSNSPTQFVTPLQVAQALQVDRSTVSKWIAQQKIPAIKLGKIVRIRLRDFENLVNDHDLRKGD